MSRRQRRPRSVHSGRFWRHRPAPGCTARNRISLFYAHLGETTSPACTGLYRPLLNNWEPIRVPMTGGHRHPKAEGRPQGRPSSFPEERPRLKVSSLQAQSAARRLPWSARRQSARRGAWQSDATCNGRIKGLRHAGTSACCSHRRQGQEPSRGYTSLMAKQEKRLGAFMFGHCHQYLSVNFCVRCHRVFFL